MAKANVSNTLVVPAASKVFPYHDDFNEDKNFHRILFRPGKGLQGRELTQIQTILQNQIERFGNHIFKNGSSVIGGDIWVQDRSGASINLSLQYANTDIDLTSFENKIVVLDGDDDAIKFVVREVWEGDDTTPPALFGEYTSVNEFQPNQTIKVQGENIRANAASANVSTTCRFAHIRDSIYFFNGFFIKVPKQSIAFSRYGERGANVKIGLEFSESIVTENEDSSLLDPAQESFNFQAPGASRYNVELNLATRAIDSEDVEKFVELIRVERGLVKSLINTPVYSEIEEVLARRTYEESGNYTVKPFIISFNLDRFDPQNFVAAALSPGKAYVFGYEYETISDTEIRIPKARSKSTVNDFDLNMNYGNYVVTDGLKGDFGITTMDTFDIHCVQHQFIDYSSNATYQTTKTGTGRTKMIEFYSGDVDVDTRKYEFYLSDTQYRSITSNANVITSTTITMFNGTTLLSANTNAYKNATLRISSGEGSGYSYNIAEYDATNRRFTIDRPFYSTPNQSSNVSIEFDFSDTSSFVKRVGYTPGAIANAFTNITTLNKTTGTLDGSTFISEPSLNTLVFKYPDTFIANGISDQVYSYTRKYSSVQFTSGTSATISSGLNEDFVGTTASSNIASTVMNNFLVICSDPLSSGRTVGEVIKVTSSVAEGSPEQATFATNNVAETFIATIYSKMEFKQGVESKLKSLITANTKTFSGETPSAVFVNDTGSNTTVYINAGQVVIQNPTRRVGTRESLYISDVVAVSKIYNLNGEAIPEADTNLNIYDDVTERFEFDNGQRDNFYDHASIRLKSNFAPVKGPLIVCCRYYEHTLLSGEGGYFSVDSYPSLNADLFEEGTSLGDGYSNIPEFITSTGTSIPLRDAIDFRPKRENASNTFPNFTLSGIKIPNPTTDFTSNYSFYLGRRDLIILAGNREIRRVQGIPAKNPQDPSVPQRSMVMYSLDVQPYTETTQNVVPRYIENKRYTMRDIGKIEKRVENLEYYVSLNTLEKSALDITIRDTDGLERTKYGIFADNFTGHRLGASTRADYQCSMELNQGWMQAKSNNKGFMLSANTTLSSNVVFTSDKAMLAYREIPFLTQGIATKFAPLAEMLYSSFRGRIFTLPEGDIWKSMNTAPDIVITDTANSEYTTVNVYDTIVNSTSR